MYIYHFFLLFVITNNDTKKTVSSVYPIKISPLPYNYPVVGLLEEISIQEEFKFLQQLVRKMEYNDIIGTDYKLLVWVGISNIANYTMWENVDGQNINDTGFHKWAKGNGETFSDSDLEPRCVGIDAMNDGLRDFWCHHHQPYICEKTVS
ncbi:uncharacterized protein LOC106135690 isoform X2 [Amyelois transitella]|uniref:uncharacterized protein LOC106135690 isoform X2 n=1 Tax=Amyelois transitella TaxID=680683 RepID=UPI002990741C|nr:uncharacterized protein LOC106135690 isoform X2 [Amyelois transitella]